MRRRCAAGYKATGAAAFKEYNNLIMGMKTQLFDDGQAAGVFMTLLLLALGLTYLAMSPSLENGFVNWDETYTILQNPRIRTLSLESVKAIFSGPDMQMYTPLSILSYAVNYHFAGLDPVIYHAFDLLLHLANTALVMILVRLLFSSVWAAFFTAILFGIHPAHVESVAWAAERKDVLSAFFYLASLTAWSFGPGKVKTYLLSLALFICALFSKPMAVTLPAALLLIDYLKSEKLELRHWLNKVPFLALAAGFALVQMSYPGNTFGMHWAKRLLVPLYNLGFYIYTLVWPFSLSAMYIAVPGGKPAIYGLAAAAAAGMFLFWKYFRRDKELVFGAAFYVLLLLPVLQFFPFGPVISADRYTYLSSIGIFSAGAVFAGRLWRRLGSAHRNIAAVCAIAAVLTLATASRVRCTAWKDGVTLWSDTARNQPPADLIYTNLCDAYLNADMTGKAETCLNQALRLNPENIHHRYNACRLLLQKKEFAKAQTCFEKMFTANPCLVQAFNYAGDICLRNGETAKAERYYAGAVRCDKYNPSAYRKLGQIALSRKDKAKAVLFYEAALAVEPADKATRGLLETLR